MVEVGVEGFVGVDLEVVDMIFCFFEVMEKLVSLGVVIGECGLVWRWVVWFGF